MFIDVRTIASHARPAVRRDFLVARDLRFCYPGYSTPVLEEVNFSLTKGEFFCLVGPSGCGKTSILNLVAGFQRVTGGQLTLDDEPIAAPGVDRAVVFQGEDALFPWLRAIDNVAFGLKIKGLAREQRYDIAQKFLELVHLEDQGSKYPSEMSGGMKQRVQIARVLANDPKIMLMDEPFGALDAQTRSTLQDQLVDIWRATAKTIIFITHDVSEAVLLADRVGVMSKGPGSRVASIVPIELARPRRRSDPGFGEMWEHINSLIEGKRTPEAEAASHDDAAHPAVAAGSGTW